MIVLSITIKEKSKESKTVDWLSKETGTTEEIKSSLFQSVKVSGKMLFEA